MGDTLAYGDPLSMVLEPDQQAVRHIVRDGSREYVCRVSREALEDLARVGHAGKSDLLEIAQQNFDLLTDEWGIRISTGKLEPDGSVLLRSDDLT